MGQMVFYANQVASFSTCLSHSSSKCGKRVPQHVSTLSVLVTRARRARCQAHSNLMVFFAPQQHTCLVWMACPGLGGLTLFLTSGLWVAHFTCAQMFVRGSQIVTVRSCVRFVKTVGSRTPHPLLPFGSSTQLHMVPPVPSRLCACMVATDHPPGVGLSLSVACCCSYRACTVDHSGFYPRVMVVLVACTPLVGWSSWWALPVLPTKTLHSACLWPG